MRRRPRRERRAETIDLFRSWTAAGKHVILSSHVLHEVDVMSDQVVLVSLQRIRRLLPPSHRISRG